MRLKAHAKINWALNVVAPLPQGYHALDMLVQRVELADELEISPDGKLSLTVEGSDAIPNDQNNLVYRAALALQAKTGCHLGANILLRKRVPSQAGLGGGSADAAAALQALNALWNTGLSHAELSRIAAGLGADVPLCLVDGLMRVRGFGEAVAPLSGGRQFHLLILQPGIGLSTGEVFKEFDRKPDGRAADIDNCMTALLSRDMQLLGQTAYNQLQQAARRLCAPLGQALAGLYDAGAGFAQMSGSGSAVYGVFETEAHAKQAQEALRIHWPVCLYTKTRGE